MNITIRRANPREWQIVQKLIHEVFISDAQHDPHLDLTWPFSEDGIERYKKYVTDPTFIAFIAFEGTNPVGLIVGAPKEISYRTVKMAEIVEIGVTPTHRSSGIGALLVTRLRQWCRENGYQKLLVNAYCKNTKAISFYKRQGLQPADIDFEMEP
ncbi:MAG TPA: GNAT family N-acetyltransferase [Patescibacteria group bacterium]|nr:GNAT family N-acetyltransferase [Patescibacteria group bacterium]